MPELEKLRFIFKMTDQIEQNNFLKYSILTYLKNTGLCCVLDKWGKQHGTG